MNKMVVFKAGFGGLFTGVSLVSLVFNSTAHQPAIFILSSIVGIFGGCGLLAVAYLEAK